MKITHNIKITIWIGKDLPFQKEANVNFSARKVYAERETGSA